MANFAAVAHVLEGILSRELNLARGNQGMWEWFNALNRVISQNRFTGTVRVSGPTLLADGSNTVESNAVTLFGVLVDNSMAAEDAFLLTSDVAAAGGNDDWLGSAFWAPRNAITTYVLPNGGTFATGLFLADCLGTSVGIEAQTASTTQCTTVVVYTEA